MDAISISIELWEALRPHVAGGYDLAAEDFVNVLADSGVDLEEFNECTSDRYLKKALLEYIDHDDLDEDDEFEDFHHDEY